LRFNRIHVFFFDMDGVLSVGKQNPRYLGGRKVVSQIKSSGKQAFVLTNDSTHTSTEIHQNLQSLGFNFSLEDVLTSSYLTALFLTQRFKRSVSFLLLGERGLLQELLAAGHRPSDHNPDVVIVGLDRQLNYAKLDRALRALRDGAILVGSYGGAVYMGDNGPALSAGPIIRALEYGASKRAVIIGKPSPRMFRLALQRAETKPVHAVMIGDQIETDMLGAKRAGVHTILVLSGVETRNTLRNSALKPELVIDRVDELEQYVRQISHRP
jgi:HAD superfamily hydrolase (TIGR01450 family)